MLEGDSEMYSEALRKVKDGSAVVCVVGMGYVGWPLAEAFSEHVKVIGYDTDKQKVDFLNKDTNSNLVYSYDPSMISESDIVVICVPTPLTKHKDPDLSHVISASETVGKNLKEGSLVVLESTYYPGVTEDLVVPILERESGLTCGQGFKVGYSPERINPGDDLHTVKKVTKIVAGMDGDTLEAVAGLYGLITDVHRAPDIRTAEAAKLIENVQRDLNIALVNELALIMHRLDLDIDQVLEAAATKWNFHRYEPGLVGGHCIPVNPYYLLYKAQESGYYPQVILAGRAVNDSMPSYVAEMTVKGLILSDKLVKGSKVLVMGLTYKENVPDMRESQALVLCEKLKAYGVEVFAWEPLLPDEDIMGQGITPTSHLDEKIFDAVVVTVRHDRFTQLNLVELLTMMPENPVLVDVKGIYKKEAENKNLYYRKL